jgi:hypothetical protein
MRNFILIAALGALLATAIAVSAQIWWRIGEVEMSFQGIAALVLGALLSLLLGGGLMALMFYSSRHGHDEAAGEAPDLGRGPDADGDDRADGPPAV